MLPKLPPAGSGPTPPQERTIKDAAGTAWRLRQIEPKPGAMGSCYCVLLFDSGKERRWKPFLRGSLFTYQLGYLLEELRQAQPVPAGKAIPEQPRSEEPRTLTEGEWETGA